MELIGVFWLQLRVSSRSDCPRLYTSPLMFCKLKWQSFRRPAHSRRCVVCDVGVGVYRWVCAKSLPYIHISICKAAYNGRQNRTWSKKHTHNCNFHNWFNKLACRRLFDHMTTDESPVFLCKHMDIHIQVFKHQMQLTNKQINECFQRIHSNKKGHFKVSTQKPGSKVKRQFFLVFDRAANLTCHRLRQNRSITHTSYTYKKFYRYIRA